MSADVSSRARGYGSPVDLRISFQTIDPPEGRMGREGHHDWLPFVGWLELISVLERFVEAAQRPLPEALTDGAGPEDGAGPPT
jgi:hypothetical protein